MIKIAIIGYGRFGRLFADQLKKNAKVYVLTEKVVEDGDLQRIGIGQLSGMDWVIPTVPISALQDTLKKIKNHLKAGTLIMDVCSVKVKPCQWLIEEAPENVEIIGSHPMFGPDSAKDGFDGLQMIIVPLRVSMERLAQVKETLGKLGLSVMETSAEEHDRQAADCLSLVHFLGRGLGRYGITKQKISTLGFERLLAVNDTVNNDSWQLFFDMQKYNPFSRQARERIINELVRLDNELKEVEYE